MDRLGDLSQFDGHYPGPWIEEHGCIYCDGGNGEVAQVDLLANMTAEEYDATTRLLAAAPDLLAALKESRKEVEELRERIGKIESLCRRVIGDPAREIKSGQVGLAHEVLDYIMCSLERIAEKESLGELGG